MTYGWFSSTKNGHLDESYNCIYYYLRNIIIL